MSQISTPSQSHMSHSVNTLNTPSSHVSCSPPISRFQICYLKKHLGTVPLTNCISCIKGYFIGLPLNCLPFNSGAKIIKRRCSCSNEMPWFFRCLEHTCRRWDGNGTQPDFPACEAEAWQEPIANVDEVTEMPSDYGVISSNWSQWQF